MKNNFKVIKSSESNLILSVRDGKNYAILKVAQRGNAKLEKEHETILKLKKFSKIYSSFLPDTYLDGKINKDLFSNKFYFFQKYLKGTTLSQLIQKNKIKLNKANHISNALIEKLILIIEEDLKNCVNQKPSEIFRKLIMTEFQNLIKRPHLHFVSSNLRLKIGNKFYKNLENSLERIFSKKIFLAMDEQDQFLTNLGHFNFHGENIIISDPKDVKRFKLIDPDTRWKVLDPIFSLARYFYTYSHDTAEKKNYYIKSNIFDLKSNNKTFYFKTNIIWPTIVKKVYEKMFNENLLKKKFDKFEKFRFSLTYLLCLLRGANANYEEKVFFLKNNINQFKNNGVFLSLLAIQYAHEIAYEK